MLCDIEAMIKGFYTPYCLIFTLPSVLCRATARIGNMQGAVLGKRYSKVVEHGIEILSVFSQSVDFWRVFFFFFCFATDA